MENHENEEEEEEALGFNDSWYLSEDITDSFSFDFQIYRSPKGAYLILDADNQPIFERDFEEIDPFVSNEGMVAYCEGEKWGFVHARLKQIYPAQYESVGAYNEGLAAVSTGGEKWGFINKAQKMVVAEKFAETSCFSMGLAAVADENGLWGYVNAQGRLLIPHQYNRADDFNERTRLAIVFSPTAQKPFAVINEYGEQLLASELIAYNHAGDLIQTTDGRNDVNKIGYCDLNGKQVIENIYDDGGAAEHGLICVQKGDKCGYIDYTGEAKTEFIFDSCYHDFNEHGIACPSINEKYGAIDRRGRILVPFEYEACEFFLPEEEEEDENAECFFCQKGDITYFYDLKGNCREAKEEKEEEEEG